MLKGVFRMSAEHETALQSYKSHSVQLSLLMFKWKLNITILLNNQHIQEQPMQFSVLLKSDFGVSSNHPRVPK